jgi:hypothetical protein
MDIFYDIHEHALTKSGEELCGDTIQTTRTDRSTIIVLSDGLGSGVKACILSTLTTRIILTMLQADVPLSNVIETVIGTLPICKVRNIAYATFTIIRIEHETGQFEVINFDNPAVFFFKHGRPTKLQTHSERILDHEIVISEGVLERGDFLGAVSDGVLHAGLGQEFNFGWGWDNVCKYIGAICTTRYHSAQVIVDEVITRTNHYYHGRIGDDASFVGVAARRRNQLMVFTGPPLDPADDADCVTRLVGFPGRTVVCGGTTASIVAGYMGAQVETDIATMREDIPPIGKIEGIDLVTEGIFTMSRVLEYIQTARGDLLRLPADKNGAVMLTRELLMADTIDFLVGQKVNEVFQSPLLPKNMSVRRKLVDDVVAALRECGKEVRLEYV